MLNPKAWKRLYYGEYQTRLCLSVEVASSVRRFQEYFIPRFPSWPHVLFSCYCIFSLTESDSDKNEDAVLRA